MTKTEKGKGRGRPKAAVAVEEDEVDEKGDAKEGSQEETEDEKAESSTEVEIEACRSWRVFSQRANYISEYLSRSCPEIPFRFALNPQIPRRGAFEVTVRVAGKQGLLWTGLKKGPPRKEKFPDPEALCALFQDFINRS